MAPRFIGRYEHALDIKGRVILPARFRADLGPKAFLSEWKNGCLALWTPPEFDKQAAEHELRQDQGPEELALARVFASMSAEVDIDRQGRVAIPAYLREFAHLEVESPMLVTGALNRVELWNPVEWERRVKPAEAQLIDGGNHAPVPEPA